MLHQKKKVKKDKLRIDQYLKSFKHQHRLGFHGRVGKQETISSSTIES